MYLYLVLIDLWFLKLIIYYTYLLQKYNYLFILFCRYVLSLFIFLFNIVCVYDLVGYGVSYNYFMFIDLREQLVEGVFQVFCVIMENELFNYNVFVDGIFGGIVMDVQSDV